jgi:hypothetical protein
LGKITHFPALPVRKFLIVFMATMVRPLPGGVSTLPFFLCGPPPWHGLSPHNLMAIKKAPHPEPRNLFYMQTIIY